MELLGRIVELSQTSGTYISSGARIDSASIVPPHKLVGLADHLNN